MRKLFLDDTHVARMDGLVRRLHPAEKHPGNPILNTDRPWDEDRVQIGGNSVLYDPEARLFRMYYYPKQQAQTLPFPCDDDWIARHWSTIAYAESADGVTWHKPDLAQVRWLDRCEPTNLLRVFPQYAERVGVLYDHAERDPGRRFKMMAWTQKEYARPKGRTVFANHKVMVYDEAGKVLYEHPYDEQLSHWGINVAFSPDGIEWRAGASVPLMPCYSDTGHSLVRDPRMGRYVAFGRFNRGNTFTATDTVYSNRTGQAFNIGRAVARIESEDCLHWSTPELVMAADHLDPQSFQIDAMIVSMYEGMYLGVIEADRRPHDNPWLPMQLAASHDGRRWTRIADRQPIVEIGERGAWDDECVRPGSGPILVGDRVYLFYCGVQKVEGRYHLAPGLATWRRDGFVSLSAGAEGGELLTRPFIVEGDRLHLNIDASDGEAVVEVCDSQGEPYHGWSRRYAGMTDNTINTDVNPEARPDTGWGVSQPSRPIRGNHLDVVVQWEHNDLNERVGKPVSLRVRLRRARLFSFWTD